MVCYYLYITITKGKTLRHWYRVTCHVSVWDSSNTTGYMETSELSDPAFVKYSFINLHCDWGGFPLIVKLLIPV